MDIVARRRRKRHKRRRHPVTTPASKPTPTPSPSPTGGTGSMSSPTPSPTSGPTSGPTSSPSPSSSPKPTSTAWASPLPVATSRERLYLNRFGTGFTQAALTRLRAAGSPDAWLAAQLDPASVPEDPKVADVDRWFAPLFASAADKYAADKAKTKASWTYGLDLGNWTMLRRVHSTRSLLERMTDFWSHALHVPIGHERAWVYRFDYDATIRSLALGRFEDLLIACSLHPAMRVYLDNWTSVKGKPNENQGRELLELHTVGRTAGYTESDVKSSAVILSGYTVDWGGTFAPSYNAAAHTTGPVSVLDFSDPNGNADGQAVTTAYLKYLAHHPATARRLATKLATYFVSDNPSDALVGALADAYTANDTNISAVLRVLSVHPEFLTSEGQKVLTPYDDLVAAVRRLDVQAQAPTSGSSFVNALTWVQGSEEMFSWPRPDGAPINGAAWSSASRLFSSFAMHENLAGGYWPQEAVTYRAPASWLPTTSLRFDAYVDHLSRLWFGRAADARLQKITQQAVSGTTTWATITASTVVTAHHQLAGWEFARLAMALLDTPDHMTT